jgi:hypothetical protein
VGVASAPFRLFELLDLFAIAALTCNLAMLTHAVYAELGIQPVITDLLWLLIQQCLILRLFPASLFTTRLNPTITTAQSGGNCSTPNQYFGSISTDFLEVIAPANIRNAPVLENNFGTSGVFASFTSELFTRVGGSLDAGFGVFASNDVFNITTTLAGTFAGYSSTADLQAPVSVLSTRLYLSQYYHILGCFDYLNDWRHLKLEREIWRSIDDLSTARKH